MAIATQANAKTTETVELVESIVARVKTMTKTNRPIKGDGEYRKHRNKHQKRYYWKRERQAYKRSAKEQIEN
jgi:hypothetical protein